LGAYLRHNSESQDQFGLMHEVNALSGGFKIFSRG
jgi:hypothetical protein